METKLYKEIKNILLSEFNTLDEAAQTITKHGLINCSVSNLCCYWQFEEIFKTHKKEIEKYYRELFEETGLNFETYFGKNWTNGDIFAPAKGNEAILAIGAVASICDEVFENEVF